MDLDPSLDHSRLSARKLPIQNIARLNSKYGFLTRVHGVDVRQVVLASIEPVQVNEHTIEAANQWHRRDSRCRAVVVVEHVAKPCALGDCAGRRKRYVVGSDELVAKSLMISLKVVVLHEFAQR